MWKNLPPVPYEFILLQSRCIPMFRSVPLTRVLCNRYFIVLLTKTQNRMRTRRRVDVTECNRLNNTDGKLAKAAISPLGSRQVRPVRPTTCINPLQGRGGLGEVQLPQPSSVLPSNPDKSCPLTTPLRCTLTLKNIHSIKLIIGKNINITIYVNAPIGPWPLATIIKTAFI